MRLLHFSDLHLGVENYGTIDSRTGLSTRVADFLRVLDMIIDDAIAQQVDAVLFTGDAFKNRDPSPTLQRELARRIILLAAANVPIVILIGNHDLPNVLTRATPVEIYQVLSIPGVHVVRQIDRLTIETKSGPLQIVALPWVTRSMLLAADEYRDLPEAELDQQMASIISQAIGKLSAALDPSLPAVLMAHVSVQGAVTGFEQSIMLGRDVTVGLDDMHSPAFDYVALGHIHKHQQLCARPPAVYAGSPERIDFGEEREPKGYVLVTIYASDGAGRETSWQFVELPARRFESIRIEAYGGDPMEVVRRDLDRLARDIDGAIVRCYVEVDPGREKSVNTQEIRRGLIERGAAYVAHVIVESVVQARARQAISEEHARDSLRMLNIWLETKEYDPGLRDRIAARGRELIQRRTQEQSRMSSGTGRGSSRG